MGGGKRNKGGKSGSPDKGDPSNKGDPVNKDLPTDRPPDIPGNKIPPTERPPEEKSDDKTGSRSDPNSNVASMLQGRGFEIIDDDKIKDTACLSRETRETILDNLLAHKQTMCHICVVKLNKTCGKLDISDEFGQWLT